jgi:hypothetical protein
MEMEQTMERLLAKTDSRMDASTKAMQEKIDAKCVWNHHNIRTIFKNQTHS